MTHNCKSMNSRTRAKLLPGEIIRNIVEGIEYADG